MALSMSSSRAGSADAGASLQADALAQALQERVQDLGSPAGALVEPLIGSDPTLEIVKLAEALQPARAPQRLHGSPPRTPSAR